MRYYYTDAANQPAGPCDLEQLKALAAEGKINDYTSVIPEGGQVWTTYGAITGGSPAVPPAPPPARGAPMNLDGIATILGDTVGKLLGKISGWLSPQLLESSLRFGGRYGHFAVVAGALFGLIVAIKLASQYHSFGMFATAGLGFVLLVAVAQFSAQRFMSAGTRLIASTPNRLSSKSFLECVGLFAVLGALGSLIMGLITSIQADTMVPLIPALLTFAYLLYFAMNALHPEEVNVTIAGDASAGEEAVSLLAFFIKVWLKLAPLFFFLLAVAGAIFTLLAIFNVGVEGSQAMLAMIPALAALGPLTQSIPPGQSLVLIACLVPILIYFFFLIWYLMLDLIRAILSIPGKLDALKKA